MLDEWEIDDAGRITAIRRAELWRSGRGLAVTCDLCYRRCELKPGELGWCKARANDGGRMVLLNHGVLSSLICAQRAYQADPFLLFRPGATSLFIGGVNCTSACTFCMSKEIAWNPDKIPWGYGERQPAQGLFFTQKAMVHPKGVIWLARYLGATDLLFGINEPVSASFEYTLDLARLAAENGLIVSVETNGFSTVKAIKRLAPFVRAVDVGTKGSLDPGFYARWMRAPGAVEAVKRSLLEWRRAGVHLVVGDLISPPHLQDDATFERAATDFYSWIRAELGELTPILPTLIMMPGPLESGSKKDGLFLPATSGPFEAAAYAWRVDHAIELGRAAGLPYTHGKRQAGIPILCHNCGGELIRWKAPRVYCSPCLEPFQYCWRWGHEQHVTGGRCDHCGAAVPVVTLTPEELQAARAAVENVPQEARYQGEVIYRPA